MYWTQLWESLRVLVLSFDNLTSEQKASLTTASEVRLTVAAFTQSSLVSHNSQSADR
jgi:hypothetical protein